MQRKRKALHENARHLVQIGEELEPRLNQIWTAQHGQQSQSLYRQWPPSLFASSCVIGQLPPYTLDVAFCLRLGGVGQAFGFIQSMLPDAIASA